MPPESPSPSLPERRAAPSFLGLAALMRLTLTGGDLASLGQELLARAAADPADAQALLDAATILFIRGMDDIAQRLQDEALQLVRLYHLPAQAEPVRLRLLALMAPGDLQANVPLECLVEGSDVDLRLHYLRPGDDLAEPLPEHDVLFVALSETEANGPTLDRLEPLLARWPRPVLNRPGQIRRLARDRAAALLRDQPGIAMPPTERLGRQELAAVAAAEAGLVDDIFPLIVRPVDSHAGNDLERVDGPQALAGYLDGVAAEDFFVSPFIDYRNADGLYRKYRVALIEGRPYACHQGISAHWMIHYLNAGMADCATKRAEEARFMADFDTDFARRHAAALEAVHRCLGLDYVCIDCGETADGRLLIFEVDHAMIVHALDPVDLFPYKQPQMRKVFAAFQDMLAAAAGRTGAP